MESFKKDTIAIKIKSKKEMKEIIDILLKNNLQICFNPFLKLPTALWVGKYSNNKVFAWTNLYHCSAGEFKIITLEEFKEA